MDNELLFQRIINGFYYISYRNKQLRIVTPTSRLRYKAQRYCKNLENSLKFEQPADWMSEQKRMQILHYFNIWNSDLDEQLDQLYKNQKDLKLALFLGYRNKNNRKMFKNKINNNNSEIYDLEARKSTYTEHTKKFFLERAKNFFLIKHMVYLKDKLFLINEDNFIVLQHFLGVISSNNVYDDIPHLIRSGIWSDHWMASKGRIIKKHVTDWSEEQLFAINSTIALESIKKHPEAPDKEVLEDPDATEGWIIHQNKKDEKEKKKQQIESSLEGRSSDKDEVYVMTGSREEEQEVYDLNDPMKRKHIKKWQNYIAEQGQGKTTDWVDIPEVIEEKKRVDRIG